MFLLKGRRTSEMEEERRMAYMNTGIFVGCFLLLKGVYYYWYGGRGSNQISN